MFVNRAKLLGRMALVISAGIALNAQDVTGMLMGTIRDDKGQVQSGATVLIRASQLIQPRRVVTDVNGNFRAPMLPPGDYAIQVTKDGYLGQSATNIRLSVGASIRQDFSLKKIQSQASTTVEVIASSATADKTEAKTQTSFSSDQLLTLPTRAGDRAFTGAADMSPGVTRSPGGGTTIRGGKSQETGFTVNGTSIKDEYEGRLTSTVLIDDSVEDTQVIQSPLHARYGRTGGGIVNVVTKSGGNDFAGSARYYVSRNDWEALRPYQLGNDNAFANRKFDVFLSGPILKDRLWFALSLIESPTTTNQYIIGNGESASLWAPWTQNSQLWNSYDPAYPMGNGAAGAMYDIGQPIQSANLSSFINAKLTYAINADHTLDFSYNENTYEISNRDPYAAPPGSGHVITRGSHSLSQSGLDKYWSYGYKGTFGSSTFLEARYTKVVSESVFPAPTADMVVLNHTWNGAYPYGFNITPRPDARNNQSGSLNLKQFLDLAGTHEIDFGFEMFEAIRGTSTALGSNNRIFWTPWATEDSALLTQFNIGADPYGRRVAFPAVNYLDAAAVGEFYATSTASQANLYRKYFGTDGTTKNKTESIYLNDAWVLNSHWNVMLGLRMDRFRVQDTDATELVKQWGPLSPRVQVRFDPDGSTKHLFTFTAAKYIQDIPVGFTDAFIKKASAAWAMYGWVGQGQGNNGWTDFAGLTNPANYDTAAYRYSDARYNAQKSDIKNPYVYEFTLGYKHTYQDGSMVGISGIYKEWKNDFAVWSEDDDSFFVNVPDPSGSGLPAKLTLATRYGNSDLLKRNYKGIELEWRNVINSVWVFGGNYTYSRLMGNNEGGDNGGQGFRVNTAQGALSYRNALTHPYNPANQAISEDQFAPNGALLNDRPNKARIYLVATLPLGKGRISYSAALRYDSGTNYSANAAASMTGYVRPASAIVPAMATAWTQWSSPRGAFRQNDSTQTDVKIDYALPIYGKVQVMGDIQINNVFNTMQVLFWNTGFSTTVLPLGSQPRVTNPSAFGRTNNDFNNYQQGRTVMASLGLKF